MKCEVCGKSTMVNYGDGNTVICQDCSISGEAKGKMEKEEEIYEPFNTLFNIELKQKQLLIIGMILEIAGYSMFSIGFIVFLPILNDEISFKYLFISVLGLLIIAFTYLIPYIISIEKNLKKGIVFLEKYNNEKQDASSERDK